MKRKPSKEPLDLTDTEGTEIYGEKGSPVAGDGGCSREGATTDSLPSFDDTSEPVYGPALPPQLVKPNKRLEEKTEGTNLIGPCLPEADERDVLATTNTDGNFSVCHANNSDTEDERLTKGDDNNDNDNDDNDRVSDQATDDSTDHTFGPALPPHLVQKRDEGTREKIIGPMLPSSFQSKDDGQEKQRLDSAAEGEEEEEEDDAIGPLPADHPLLKNSHVHEQLEQRARRIMDERREEDNSVLNQREEWMTELPPAQANNLGLSSRKFRVRPAPDMSDRTCWTDTPAQKAEKQRKREEEKSHRHKGLAEEHGKRSVLSESGKCKKREKSLLEMHQGKLRKKKKKEEKEAQLTGGSTRRPFDRDIDLKANQFDQVQKKAIFMKAQLLDERFSRGQI